MDAAIENQPDSSSLDGKRKSVSFVDEKLISNAIKSTSISGNESDKMKTSSSGSTDDKQQKQKANDNSSGKARPQQNGGKHGGHHQNNHRNYSNSNHNNHYGHYKTNGGNNKTHGGHYQQKSSKAVNQSNPVIIYYSNPDVEINVDELLNKCQQQKQDSSKKTQETTKPTDSSTKTSKPFNNHHQGGGFNKSHGGHHHHNKPMPAQLNNNWKNKDNKNNGMAYGNHSNYHKRSHPSYWKPNSNSQNLPPKKDFRRNDNGSSSKAEPITIYYNDSSVSLEDKLKLLKDKSSDENPEANTNVDKSTDSQDSSQKDNVINSDEPVKPKNENKNEVKNEDTAKTMSATASAAIETVPTASTLPVSNDHEDVISGGRPIQNARLPAKPAGDNDGHMVICTLVSHPGHFYVKFLNRDDEQQLEEMTKLYQTHDEHIEMTLDVLRPGQYFAAQRQSSWLRVKLLYVQSADSINCMLIDQGCLGVFKLGELQPLYNKFRAVPRQAIRVCLSDVRPKETDWLPNEALAFKELIENCRLKTGKIGQPYGQEITDPETPIEIELFFDDSETVDESLRGKNVAEILIERNLAVKK